VETAFLYGTLNEDLFMNIPEGYNIKSNKESMKAQKLKRSIYGLVQAARLWNKKFEEEILKLRFRNNDIDTCVLS
jgi:hypothetical protein